MTTLELERRPDGSLLLSSSSSRRWGLAGAGIGAGVLVLAGVALGEATVLAGVLAVPVGLITLLAGIGVARHRDWILFDRTARQISFRRGLSSIFRPVRVFGFDDVEAIRVEALGGSAVAIGLVRAGELEWPIEASADRAHVTGLVTALREVAGWPVIRAGESTAAVK